MTVPMPEAGRLHEELREATSRLLGDTIALSDQDWHAPSRLPGWTRAHVATHLARQADAVARLVTGALEGRPGRMYASEDAREAEIAEGADRDGPQLQTDLDTSATALDALFARTEEAGAWDEPVTLRDGSPATVAVLPRARLAEVVLHHVDLDTGFGLADLPSGTARVLLTAAAHRMAPRFELPVHLQVDDGPQDDDPLVLALGPARATDEPVEVHGTTVALLGWLTTRGSEVPAGAAGLDMPPY